MRYPLQTLPILYVVDDRHARIGMLHPWQAFEACVWVIRREDLIPSTRIQVGGCEIIAPDLHPAVSVCWRRTVRTGRTSIDPHPGCSAAPGSRHSAQMAS